MECLSCLPNGSSTPSLFKPYSNVIDSLTLQCSPVDSMHVYLSSIYLSTSPLMSIYLSECLYLPIRSHQPIHTNFVMWSHYQSLTPRSYHKLYRKWQYYNLNPCAYLCQVNVSTSQIEQKDRDLIFATVSAFGGLTQSSTLHETQQSVI